MAAEGEGPGSSNRLQGRTQDPLAEEGPQRAVGLVHGAGECWRLALGHQRLWRDQLPEVGGAR